jgi:ubiquitin-protein ligase
MLYVPNSSDPANINMQEVFDADENEYWRQQQQQAKYFYDASDLS